MQFLGTYLEQQKSSVLLDFGVSGSDVAQLAVADTTIKATDRILAFIDVKDSVDHSADEHLLEAIEVTAGNVQEGVGFTIYGKSLNFPLYGKFNVFYIKL